MPHDHTALHDPDRWCALSNRERREALATALEEALDGADGVIGVRVAVGPVQHPWDLSAVVETDVGELRTFLWSHARANVFCDASIHPNSRKRLSPAIAAKEAAARLRQRLSVPFRLQARGLTVTLPLSENVTRVWAAEKSLFKGTASVTREDRIEAPGDADLRELLAAMYTGPALRVAAEDGTAFHLPAAHEPEEAEWVSLCAACGQWTEGSVAQCPACGAPADTRLVSRPPRR